MVYKGNSLFHTTQKTRVGKGVVATCQLIKSKHTRITTERKNICIVTAQAEIIMKVCNSAWVPKEMNNMPCVLPTIFFKSSYIKHLR
jgi:hypothetical protein